jgi:hypothetical protein
LALPSGLISGVFRLKLKTMNKLIMLIAMTCCFAMKLYAQSDASKMQHAVNAYAFLYGQEQSLLKIAVQFPALNDEIQKMSSGAFLFNRAKTNIESYLKGGLPEGEFNRLQKEIATSAQKAFEKPIESEAYARNYLGEVRQRLDGGMDIPMCRTILSFAYEDFPENEMTDGYTIMYNIDEHQKAKKANLKIVIPRSWAASEAEQAETVQQFTSCGGHGSEKILIMIHELPEVDDDMFSEAAIREMMPPDTQLFRTECMTIAGTRAAVTETEEIFKGKQYELKVRMLHFMFAKGGKLFCIQGSVGPSPKNVDLNAHLQKYMPLFRKVAMSIDVRQ